MSDLSDAEAASSVSEQQVDSDDDSVQSAVEAEEGKGSHVAAPAREVDPALIAFLRNAGRKFGTGRTSASADDEDDDRALDDADDGSDDEDDDELGDGDMDEEREEDDESDNIPSSAPPIEFANAMARIMAKPADESNPVLSGRTTKLMQLMREAHTEERSRKVTLKERRERRERFHKTPTVLDGVRERRLRKIATKGVVALFNAIREHRKLEKADDPKATVATGGKKDDQAIHRRQSNFLDLLRKATGAAASGNDTSALATHGDAPPHEVGPRVGAGGGGGSASWEVLDDNLLLGSTMRSYDRDESMALQAKNRAEKGRKVKKGDVFLREKVATAGRGGKVEWSDSD